MLIPEKIKFSLYTGIPQGCEKLKYLKNIIKIQNPSRIKQI